MHPTAYSLRSARDDDIEFIKRAYTGIASQVRGLAEKLKPSPKRKAVGRKKETCRKPVAAKRKPERQRGRAKPTEKGAEQIETITT